jgi:hypothetical protein
MAVGCYILAVFARVGIFGISIPPFPAFRESNLPLKCTKGGAPAV